MLRDQKSRPERHFRFRQARGQEANKCKTVLRNKYNVNGALDRRKARVVARGFAQCPGVYFFETFVPVARLGSFRLLIALAAKFDLKISQLDVETVLKWKNRCGNLYGNAGATAGDVGENDYSRKRRH